MKKITLVVMAATVLLLAGVAASCSKDEGVTTPQVQQEAQHEAGVKYVPFFELAKGDTIAKGIFREKPEFDEDVEVLFLSENFGTKLAKPKAEGYSNSGGFIHDILASTDRNAPDVIIISGYYYYKIPVDLNEGAGGKYVYLYYTTHSSFQAITYTDIVAVDTYNPFYSVPTGYSQLGRNVDFSFSGWVDLNDGAGGPFIRLMGKRAEGNSARIVQIGVVSSSSGKSLSNFPGWRGMTIDLNVGAGGKYIYLLYR